MVNWGKPVKDGLMLLIMLSLGEFGDVAGYIRDVFTDIS
jgi:hypothetical protein